MEYKNEKLEKDYENNKNAKNKALEKIQEIVNEYVADNPDLEFKVRVENRGLFSEDSDNPVIKCSIINKKVFWISTVSFEYDIKLKDLYDFSNSSGGANKVKPIDVVNAYQEIYNSINCLNNGLKNDNTKLLELASDILYYDNKLMDINIEFRKQKDKFFQEFVTEKLNSAGIKKITDSDNDIQKAESILQRLEENGHIILYTPDIDTFKYNLKNNEKPEDAVLKVFRRKLEISGGTYKKIYHLDGKRIAKSKLLESIIGTYDLGENFKDNNERKFEIRLSDLVNAQKNKEQRDLLKELVKNGQVVKRSGLKNS